MANFPSNPSNGNTHIIGNTIWVYNSTSDSWLIQDVNEYAVANLENTPPANPDEGTIWYDSQTTGRLYIYIDGNWIDASPGDISVITGGNDITATKSGTTYTLNVDDSFVRNTGDTMTGTLKITGNLDLESVNPQITFNGTSDAGVDMAIKATPEGLNFYEPEDGNKIHFQILDDTGVNAPYGYKWNGQSLDDRYISGISTGGGLSGSGTSGTVTVSHADTSSQGSSNNSGRTYIQDISLDTYGHVTGIATKTETVVNTDTNTTYSAGGGLSLSGTTFSHKDTSSQGSSNNSGRTYIQDITVDTYGHVTGIATATETVVNTDTNTTYSAGGGLSRSGTTFSHSNTSSQGSVNNSGNTVIQDITVDTYGHVTGINSKTIAASSIPTSLNAVGTYKQAVWDTNWQNVLTPGNTSSGSNIRFSAYVENTGIKVGGTSPGTWRWMATGTVSGSAYENLGIAVRIS
jgi:hypothetical protein